MAELNGIQVDKIKLFLFLPIVIYNYVWYNKFIS